MSNILLSDFTLSPDHFLYDGVKTHSSELIQTLMTTEHKLSLLISTQKISKTTYYPARHQLLSTLGEWQLKSSLQRNFRQNLRLIKRFIHPKILQLDSIELSQMHDCRWHHLDKIYMEELLKRKAKTYHSLRKKLWPLKNYADNKIFVQSFPFPVMVHKIPNILFIHDVIPLTHPHLMSSSSPKRWFQLIQSMLNAYQKILVVSEDTKRSILSRFKIKEDQIDVVYQSIAQEITQNSIHESEVKTILNPYRLNHKEFLLYVARLEPRKNHAKLIEAYQHSNVDLPLVLVGCMDSPRWIPPENIKRLMMTKNNNEHTSQHCIEFGGRKKIIWLNHVSHVALSILYQQARGLIYPSLAEGFGLPIVEAFFHGCPVAASNTTAMPEISKNAALLFNPYEIHEISAAIRRLCYDDDWCEASVQLGKLRAQYFSREQYSTRLMKSLSTYL